MATVAHFRNLEDVIEKDYFHQRSETVGPEATREARSDTRSVRVDTDLEISYCS